MKFARFAGFTMRREFFTRGIDAAEAIVDNKTVRVEYNDFYSEGLKCVDLIHMLQVYVNDCIEVRNRKVYAEMISGTGAYRFKLSR